MNELPLPDGVEKTNDPDEVIRLWIGDGDSFVTLNNLFGTKHYVWGMMLADIAAQAAHMLHLQTGEPIAAILDQIENGYRHRFEHHPSMQLSGRNLNPRH